MTFLWFAALICALAYWRQVLEPVGPLRSVFKTASVALLGMIAMVMGQGVLALALGLCALGDGLLSRDGDRSFMAGMASFAGGHVAYALLFLSVAGADADRLVQTPQVFAVLGLLILGVTMALRILPAAGSLKAAVALYIPIILSMSFAALTLPPSLTAGLVLAAAALFLLSDSLLAVEKFLLSEGAPLSHLLARIVWPTYWGSQALFLAAFTGVPMA